MNRTLFSLLGSIVLISSLNTAHADDQLVFAIAQEAYPPFSYKNGHGQWSGFDPELINALCRQMHSQCSLREMAWDGLIPALNSKQVDVVLNSMSITHERKQVVDFTQPYLQTPALWIAEKGVELVLTPAGLRGKSIGVQASTSHAAYIKANYRKESRIRYYNNQDDILADLRNGRIDVMLADQISVQPMLAEPDNSGLEGKGLAPSDPLFGEGIGIAVRKGNDDLREHLNQALDVLNSEGRIAALRGRYLNVPME
ncbi:transporter substrate-binding domain-containing protein [Pseudomonas sp. TTU2014-080ASC]|uniref:transporter substrate-binding domain-containing protein n=1 Tax=Pseudomonas sp. TTU2014-080ASC TaxID=1729724 RepID=UPI0007188E31|nr:transporter substrate-binding domain-containing protein [Pseudomonas sp. TTU2014-080ASC]KRW58768.1 amino acid ABC transporter substrate-binding protein [Pseudomonas sp. TTU2014-080ASC]